MENLLEFSYFTTYSLFSKCCGDVLFFTWYFISDIAVFCAEKGRQTPTNFYMILLSGATEEGRVGEIERLHAK